MIYLIGGPGRVGKTTLARKVLKQMGVPFVSTDMVYDTVMNAIPEYGLNYELNNLERSQKFKPLLQALVNSAISLRGEIDDYLIEGVDILPSSLKDLKSHQISAVFLGFSKITAEKLLETGSEIDYFRDLSESEQQDFVEHMIEFSALLKRECDEYGFEYFDLSKGYDDQLEKAYQFLVD